jgi:hypothetical protein
MKEIIEPIERGLLESELTADKMVRRTNKADNEIYIVTAHDSPNVMLEIGRLREVAFRIAGGGTGQCVDIDDEDRAEDGYKQLIVWDPVSKQIMGGYRFIVSTGSHPRHLSTEHYFRFSELFRTKYLPYTIELGRSFVIPRKNSMTVNPKAIFALDNLWDGLGALMLMHPEAKYLFGKVTMYGDYNKKARNILIYFLNRYFPDTENLMESINPVELNIDKAEMDRLFDGANFDENRLILLKQVKLFDENVPPLINSYMNLSPSMKIFGTVHNPDFGDVEETGLMITIKDIHADKAQRHLNMTFTDIEIV